jgi:hypothetical protein
LDSLRIDTVLVDFSMDPTRVNPHEHALKEALINLDSGWRLAWQQPITRIGASHGDLWIFKRSPK